MKRASDWTIMALAAWTTSVFLLGFYAGKNSLPPYRTAKPSSDSFLIHEDQSRLRITESNSPKPQILVLEQPTGGYREPTSEFLLAGQMERVK